MVSPKCLLVGTSIDAIWLYAAVIMATYQVAYQVQPHLLFGILQS